MKNKLILMLIGLFVMFFLIYNASAACIIQGYTKYQNASHQSIVKGVCENTGAVVLDEVASNGFYYLSWGGPADTCESKCGQVYVTATYRSIIPEEPVLSGQTENYPMNINNTLNWNTIQAHDADISMTDTRITKKLILKSIKKSEAIKKRIFSFFERIF